ncbi:MAG: anti-sigma factor family protein [Candidatus Krumholzibacteriia bacterium]
MDCSRFAELVQDFLDRDLPAADGRGMLAHDARCYACAELLDEYRTLFVELDALECEPAPAGLEGEVLARVRFRVRLPLRARLPRSVSRFLRPVPSQMGLAFGLTLVLLYAGAWRFGQLSSAGLDAAGRIATWSYSWSQDVAATLAWIRDSTGAELGAAAASMAHATAQVLGAYGGHLAAAAATLVVLLGAWHRGRIGRGSHHGRVSQL